jgi:glucosamine--fructose-6-phosphate aminotransferase (isomerizing)
MDCGIIGILGERPVGPRLAHALGRMHARTGQASIAMLEGERFTALEAAGDAFDIAAAFADVGGQIGVGHCQAIIDDSAVQSSYFADRVAVALSGKVANARSLRRRLIAAGRSSAQASTTQLVAHTIQIYLDRGQAPADAIVAALAHIEGAVALTCIIGGHDDLLIGAQRGSPLCFGQNDDAVFISNDPRAFSRGQATPLQDGDLVSLRRNQISIRDAEGMYMTRSLSPPAAPQADIPAPIEHTGAPVLAS